MAQGADNSLATVPMNTQGVPSGGSDGTYIRTFLVDSAGRLVTVTSTTTPSANTAVSVSASLTVISATPVQFFTALVTTDGTAAMTFYDNASAASGTVVGAIPANAPIGSVFTFNMPTANGLVVSGNAANPAVTVSIGTNVNGSDLAIPVQAGAYVASAVPKTLVTALVTADNTAAMTFYDNASAASGTVIGIIPANSPTGMIFPFNMRANNGITVSGSASNPTVTIAIA